MTQRLWADFVPAITLELPGCPQFTMENAIKRAAIRIYRNTRAWRVDDVTIVAATVVGQRDYTVTNPADTLLVGLPAIYANGDEIDELPEQEIGDNLPTDTDSTWRVGVKDSVTVQVVPAPDAAGVAIVATVAYMPADTATGIDEQLFIKHHEAIEYLAMHLLMRQTGKSWSNPREAEENRLRANREISRISTMAGPMRRRQALRVQPADPYIYPW